MSEDVLTMLKQDHRAAEALLQRFDSTAESQRDEYFCEVVQTLVGHEVAEEVVVYPAMRTAPEGDAVADARLSEQAEAEEVLAKMEGMDSKSGEFVATFNQLRDAVIAHASAEEASAFPLLKAATTEAERVELGGQVPEGQGPGADPSPPSRSRYASRQQGARSRRGPLRPGQGRRPPRLSAVYMFPSIGRVQVASYTVPTDQAEGDGTLAWKSTTYVVAQVHAAGLTGTGWTYSSDATGLVITRVLAPLLEGANPLDIGRLHERMRRSVRNLGQAGLVAAAVSAVDIALWDLKARLLSISVVSLLGRCQLEVPVYGSGGFTPYHDATTVAQLRRWVSGSGVRQVKIKIGEDWAVCGSGPAPLRTGPPDHRS